MESSGGVARGLIGVHGNRKRQRRVRLLIALGLAGGLGACRTPAMLCWAPAGLRRVTIDTSARTNDGRPTTINLLLVTDKAVLEILSKRTSDEYFAQRDQLLLDHPQGFVRRTWELPADMWVKAEDGPVPCNIAGTLVFANFLDGGPHRIRLPKGKEGTLTLGPETFDCSNRRKPPHAD